MISSRRSIWSGSAMAASSAASSAATVLTSPAPSITSATALRPAISPTSWLKKPMLTPRSTMTRPSSGGSWPVIMRNSVVLPAPLGPTRPIFSPFWSAAEASMKRSCWPFCLLMLSRRIMGTRRLGGVAGLWHAARPHGTAAAQFPIPQGTCILGAEEPAMPQRLAVYQSLWAMERRAPDGEEWSLERKLEMIRDAGFDGAGVRFIDPGYARDVTGFLRASGMTWQAQCYPQRVADLAPVLELVAELGADHVNLQPDVRPHSLEGCIPYLKGWRRVSSEAGIPVHVETHRDRMTTDLFFTLRLLDAFPDLRLTANLSHYLVGRKF